MELWNRYLENNDDIYVFYKIICYIYGLLVPDGIIRLVVSISMLTRIIWYIHY
jgi:hypothetical protein